MNEIEQNINKDMFESELIDVECLDINDDQTWLFILAEDTGQRVDIIDWSLSCDWPGSDDPEYIKSETQLFELLDDLLKKLGLAAFKASEGWLGKFKQRHHINYGKISGEARSVDMNMTHDWINKVWSKFKEKYTPSDIFNADEAGIFYKLTPDKTLKFKGEKCVGGKLQGDYGACGC
ncbi:Tigger transposable element-derived protein 4 [Eumeta japonica]|uniref:Tigger transposable element-derived protein 4 n=1 Tax=Eumeta variegata TaxID=151549 RepID=A0A4C1W3F2_EUMVA|nr:Tigger transposable element-derived protein 4 [Eumeta japonica]